MAFVDGQNLFHAAREAFGYTYPSYDVLTLAGAVCASQGWKLIQTRFYTGIPDASDNPFWHDFWSAKLLIDEPARCTCFQPRTALSETRS